MRREFLLSIIPVLLIVLCLGHFVNTFYYNFLYIIIPLLTLGIRDIIQKKHIILRNFPILGHFRYLFEKIRPEIQQYFVEDDINGRPFSREQRSLVYQRAKGVRDTSAFGTQHDLYKVGQEWLLHSLAVSENVNDDTKVIVGNDQCSKPYSCSRYNISAMSYGSLSPNAVEALNKGAKMGDFFHNTGEGGVSPYHLKHGGDLVWQIGTGYFGCRTKDGNFNPEMYKKQVSLENIKMVELKLSQGAKPGHGGMLPAKKVNAEVAKIRSVEINKDVHSPPTHKAFNNPEGLINFIKELRDLSGGKPIGFKLCVGKRREFYAICKAMLKLDIYPDFISVDGSEGGTGAAPREFSNHIGSPLMDGLNFVHNTLIGTGIRDKMKIIATGKVIDGFSLISKFALGADICCSARGMMFSLGCIQALECNSNKCPTGIATQKKSLYSLLDIESKSERVKRFQTATLKQAKDMLSAMGISSFKEIEKTHIIRRVDVAKCLSYAELYPTLNKDDLINGSVDKVTKDRWERSSEKTFNPI